MAGEKDNQAFRLSTKHGGGGQYDRYFELMYGAHHKPMMPGESGWHPPADIYETDDEIVITVDISGIHLDEIDLMLDIDQLILRGKRDEQKGDHRQYHMMELSYGPFERSFRLTTPVDGAHAQASYVDGLLTIRLRKQSEPIKKKTIIKIR